LRLLERHIATQIAPHKIGDLLEGVSNALHISI
jgi:hypothetical protein